MIVKVQISLESSDDSSRVLIYNKSRDYLYETDEKEEVTYIKQLLGERPKAYFEATVNDAGLFNIGKETKPQKW